MSGSFARLGFVVDTAALQRAMGVMDGATGAAARLGGAADAASAQINRIGTGGGAKTAAQDLGQAAAAAERLKTALNGLPANWQQMSQKERTNWTFNNQGQFAEIARARQETERLGQAQRELANSGNVGAQGLNLMAGAAGGLAAILGFQLITAIGGVVASIANIPRASAEATDSLLMLNTRLAFAYRNNSELARQSRADIIALARETGVAYSEIGRQQSELAISGRGPGLSRSQTTGLTESFLRLGLSTGADPGRIGRAQWQFQQALAIGTLRYQDYRLMAQNMPSIDDAIAAGLGDDAQGIDPNRIPGMVSRGEISAQRMVEALIRGVERLNLTIPETMERARGRLQTEWELALEEMGQAIRSSSFFQNATNLGIDLLRNSRMSAGGGTPEERLQWMQGLQETNPYYYRQQGGDARLRELQEAVIRAQSDPEFLREQSAAAAQERDVRRRAQFGYGLQAARESDPLEYARGELQQQMDMLRNGLANASGQPAEDIERLEQGLARTQARMGTLMTAFQRFAYEVRVAAVDLEAYGAGAGFEIASQARGMVMQGAAGGDLVSMSSAIDAILRQRSIGARNRTGAGMAELDITERLGFGAPGAEAERLRRIEMDVARFAQQNFGSFQNTPAARAAVEAERARIQRESDLQIELQQENLTQTNTIGFEEARRRLAATGNPLARRQLERDFAIERMRRDTPEQFRDANESQQRYGFAIEDQQTAADRTAADEERLRVMREQLSVESRLGVERQIAMARLQREQEIRQQGLNLTREQIDAELARVEAIVRSTQELELQNTIYSNLEEGARSAGGVISDVLSASIAEGIETGSIRGQAALNVLGRAAARILDNLIRAATAGLEQQATNWFMNLFSGFTGGGAGGKGFAHGGIMQAYGLGGVRSTPQMFAMAGGMGLWAEAGAEAILPLQRGTDGRLGVANYGGAAGGGAIININDYRGAQGAEPVEVQETRGPDGERMIDVTIRDTVNGQLRGGQYNGAMRAQYGLPSQIRRA